MAVFGSRPPRPPPWPGARRPRAATQDGSRWAWLPARLWDGPGREVGRGPLGGRPRWRAGPRPVPLFRRAHRHRWGRPQGRCSPLVVAGVGARARGEPAPVRRRRCCRPKGPSRPTRDPRRRADRGAGRLSRYPGPVLTRGEGERGQGGPWGRRRGSRSVPDAAAEGEATGAERQEGAGGRGLGKGPGGTGAGSDRRTRRSSPSAPSS